MLPQTDLNLPESIEVEEEPSKNYRMNLDEQTVNGFVDELSAMEQVVYKILCTERYENVIYSWDYGIELSSLIGQDRMYVIPEAERRIKEALLQDARIESVDNFSYTVSGKNSVNFTFTVHTIYGDIDTEREVSY